MTIWIQLHCQYLSICLWMKVVQFDQQYQPSVVFITHSHNNNIPQLVSSCLSVCLVCWLLPHTSSVSSVAQAGFVFAQHPSTKYNPGRCLQHQDPLLWQQGLKHSMACNSFTPSLDLTSSLAPESKPACIRLGGGEEPRCYMSPLEHAWCWGSS